MSELGERLREEVMSHGGIAAAARAVNAATNTIYNWIEKGNIPVNKLVELGSGLAVDVTYIMTGMRTQPIAPTPPANEELSQQEKVIVAKLRMLDQRERDEIEDLVEKIEQATVAKVNLSQRFRKAS